MKLVGTATLILMVFLVAGFTPSPAAPNRTVDIALGEQDVTVIGANPRDFMTNRRGLAAGDLNGDGAGDLVVGSFRGKGRDGMQQGGEAYVFFGPLPSGTVADLATATADVTIYGADFSDGLGISAAVGDVSGDGQADLILGAFEGDGALEDRAFAGEVYVLFGPLVSGTLIDLELTAPDVIVYGIDRLDELGYAVTTADVSGDGLQDLIAGARFADGPEGTRSAAGAVYAFFGPLERGTVWDLALRPADVTIIGEDGGDHFGEAVDAGDVSGDGIVDILASAVNSDGPGNSREQSGSAHVFFGPFSSGTTIDLATTTADVSVLGVRSQDNLGRDAVVGDVSGDGVGDLVTGAALAGGPDVRNATGEAYVLFGPFSSPTVVDLALTAADVRVVGADAVDRLGAVVATGDPNDDGSGDLIVNAYNAATVTSIGIPRGGMVYVLYGPLSRGITLDMGTAVADIAIGGGGAGDLFGRATVAGDVSGDGIDDLLIGASGADGPANTRDSCGEVYSVFGAATEPYDADLNPGSCPNTVKFSGGGSLKAAIVATGSSTAAQLVESTVKLEDVSAISCRLRDVSRPAAEDPTSCCRTTSPDGLVDLECTFDKRAVGQALCARPTPPANGETTAATLTARTRSGTTVAVQDCMLVQRLDCR